MLLCFLINKIYSSHFYYESFLWKINLWLPPQLISFSFFWYNFSSPEVKAFLIPQSCNHSFPFFHFYFYPENCCSLDISSFSWSFPVNRIDGCAGKSQQKSLKSPFCLTFMLILNFSTMTAVFTLNAPSWTGVSNKVCLITSNIVQKRQKTNKFSSSR